MAEPQHISSAGPGYGFRCYQRTVLALLLYVATLPLYSSYISDVFPDLWSCTYKRATGQPCPFCGTTTAIKDMYQHGVVPEFRHICGLVFLSFEFCKKVAIVWWDRGTRRLPRPLRRADIATSIAGLALCLGVYLGTWLQG